MSFSTKEYFVKETYKSIRRNGFMSFASISTVAVSLLVLGMFLMIFLNTNNLAQYLESQVQVSVYMQRAVFEKRDRGGLCHAPGGSLGYGICFSAGEESHQTAEGDGKQRIPVRQCLWLFSGDPGQGYAGAGFAGG